MITVSSLRAKSVRNDQRNSRGKMHDFMVEFRKYSRKIHGRSLRNLCTCHHCHYFKLQTKICRIAHSQLARPGKKTLKTLIVVWHYSTRFYLLLCQKAPIQALEEFLADKTVTGVPLPPVPITTRWDSWFTACLLYTSPSPRDQA